MRSFLLFIAVVASGVAYILLSAAELPASMATNFGGDGQANAYASRSSYLAGMLFFTVGFPMLLTLLAGGLPRLIPDQTNIPHREYWLAPERRAASLRSLWNFACYLGAVCSLTSASMHWLLIEVNSQPVTALPLKTFAVLLGLSILLIFAGIGWLYRRFPHPASSKPRTDRFSVR